MCAGFCASSSIHTEKLFLENGISMLNTAVTAADAVRHSSEFDPWGAIGVETGPVVANLKSCREKFVSRRKAVQDTREQWFRAETVTSSAVGESTPRTTARISDLVEVGDVKYIGSDKLARPCCSRFVSSPGKSEKKRVPVNPVAAQKKTIFCRESVC